MAEAEVNCCLSLFTRRRRRLDRGDADAVHCMHLKRRQRAGDVTCTRTVCQRRSTNPVIRQTSLHESGTMTELRRSNAPSKVSIGRVNVGRCRPRKARVQT